MGLSSDPNARRRQLANLRPGGGALAENTQAMVHGLHSARVMRPYHEAARIETFERWPWLVEGTRLARRIKLKALALRVEDWEQDVDVVFRDGKTKEWRVHGVERDSVNWLRELDQLDRELDAEQQTREAAPTASLEAILGELAEEGDQ